MKKIIHKKFTRVISSILIVASAVGSLPGTAFAADLFASSSTIFTNGLNPRAVAIGDFNADGKPDLAVANEGSNNVAVLLGVGNGAFQSGATYAVGSHPYSVAVGDFNGDAKSDLAVANFADNSVSLLIGNGNGAFQAAVSYATGQGPRSVTTADFNGDGKLDVVTAGNYQGSTTGNFSIFFGNGNGTFQAAVIYTTGFSSTAITTSDFNRDGKADVAIANAQINNTSVFIGNGDGTFQPQVNYATVANTISVTSGDLNMDGKPDLAVTGNGGVSLLLGNGDGTFLSAVNYAANSFAASASFGDLSGDGKPDLAVISGQSATVSVFVGNGDGTLQVRESYSTGELPQSVAIADFNGDGKRDVVTANYGPVGSTAGMSIMLGNGDGTLRAALAAVAGTRPYAVAAGDFNADGKLDLAVANITSANISILLGNGNGTFLPAVNYGAGFPRAVTTGDFNGDGKLDLVTANYGAGTVGVLIGNGNGTFQKIVNYTSGTNPVSVATGDFNGDGKLDAAAVNGGVGTVSIFLGNGNGTLQAAVNYAVAGYSVTIGDFNLDNRPDLAVGIDRNIAVLLGNGNGTFQAAVNYFVSNAASPVSVISDDFNADGKPDIAAALSNSSATILLGNGNGTFQAAVNYPVGPVPAAIISSDFNGDGKRDLATANPDSFFTSNFVSVLVGNGNGTFQPMLNYNVGPAPVSVATGDFNGDGRTDLVTANNNKNYTGSASVLLNIYTPSIDTTPPSAPANLGVVAVSTSQINLSWSASSDDVGVAGYNVYRNNTLITSLGAVNAFSDTGLAPNTFYGYYVTAFDAAGNTSAPSNTASATTFTPDTTPPTTPGNLQRVTPANDNTPTFTWAASSDNTGVTGYQVAVDGGAYASIGNVLTYTIAVAQTDGSHTFAVRATDAAGNASAPASLTYALDATAPDTVIDSGPNALTNSGSATFNFHSTEGASTFECSLDGATYTTCASPALYTVADGNHTFSVRATDAAGNTDSTPATRSWTVDATSPSVGPSVVTPGIVGTVAQFTMNVGVSDAGGVQSVSASVKDGSGNPVGSSVTLSGPIGATSGTWSGTFTFPGSAPDGTYSVVITATDAAGNGATTVIATITLDRTAPTVSILSIVPNIQRPSLNVTVTVAASDQTTGIQNMIVQDFTSGLSATQTSFSGSTAPGGTGTWVFNQPTALPEGAHTEKASATDNAANDSFVLSTYVIDATSPSVLTNLQRTTPDNDNTPTFTWAAATDNVGVTDYQLSIDSGAYASIGSVVTYTIATAQADGSHTFAVRATDAAGNLSAPASLTYAIDATAPDTTITSAIDGNNAAVTNGGSTQSTSITFSFTGSDNVGVTGFECSLDGAAFTACASAQTYSGLAMTAHVFQARAKDAVGNVDFTPASWSWTVLSPNPFLAGGTSSVSGTAGPYATSFPVVTIQSVSSSNTTYTVTVSGNNMFVANTGTNALTIVLTKNGSRSTVTIAPGARLKLVGTSGTVPANDLFIVPLTAGVRMEGVSGNDKVFPLTLQKSFVGGGNVSKQLAPVNASLVDDSGAVLLAASGETAAASFDAITIDGRDVAQFKPSALIVAPEGRKIVVTDESESPAQSCNPTVLTMASNNFASPAVSKMFVKNVKTGNWTCSNGAAVSGSLFWVYDPESIPDESTDVPFVYETPDNYWTVASSVTPPAGCTVNVSEQTVTVNQDAQAMLFTLTCAAAPTAMRAPLVARAYAAAPQGKALGVAHRLMDHTKDAHGKDKNKQIRLVRAIPAFAHAAPRGPIKKAMMQLNTLGASLWSRMAGFFSSMFDGVKIAFFGKTVSEAKVVR